MKTIAAGMAMIAALTAGAATERRFVLEGELVQ